MSAWVLSALSFWLMCTMDNYCNPWFTSRICPKLVLRPETPTSTQKPVASLWALSGIIFFFQLHFICQYSKCANLLAFSISFSSFLITFTIFRSNLLGHYSDQVRSNFIFVRIMKRTIWYVFKQTDKKILFVERENSAVLPLKQASWS